MYTRITLRALKVSYSDKGEGGVAVNCKKKHNFVYPCIIVRPDKYAAMSVDARQELDLKIGVAFSRLMTR